MLPLPRAPGVEQGVLVALKGAVVRVAARAPRKDVAEVEGWSRVGGQSKLVLPWMATTGKTTLVAMVKTTMETNNMAKKPMVTVRSLRVTDRRLSPKLPKQRPSLRGGFGQVGDRP